MSTSIALIAYRKSSSGIATYTIELAKALSRNFRVIMPAFGLSPTMKKEVEARNIEVVDFGRDPSELEYFGGPLIEYRLLSKRVRDSLADRLNEIDYYFFTIPGFATSFDVQISLANGWGHLGLLHAILTRLRWLPPLMKIPSMIATIEYWLMDNKIFIKARRIACTTQASYNFYKAKFGNRAVYIPPPIEPPIIKREPSEKLRVLFIARDLSIPRKNLITLLRALGMLDKTHLKGVKLMLVGYNAHKFKKWLNYLKKNGVEISIFGYVAKECISSIYSNADVLVYPSYYEELGYVVLEAMACGLPVIVSNIPSFRDMVIDGYNGFFIESNDYVKLSNLLSILIENKKMCHEMGENGLRVAKERYSSALTVKKIKNIIEEL